MSTLAVIRAVDTGIRVADGTSTETFLWVITGVNISALVFLILMVSLDLLFRWLAFGNAESVAIDLAVFAFGYSATEVAAILVAQDDANPKPLTSDDGAWIIRAVIGFIVLLMLGVYHKILMLELEAVIDGLIEERLETLPAADPRRRSLAKAKPLIERTTLLSLGGSGITGIVRVGKHKWRRLVAEYINAATCPADSAGVPERGKGVRRHKPVQVVNVKDTDLLLSRRIRFQALATFAVLGTVSVLTVILRF